MASKIFISYRRDEAWHLARMIYEALLRYMPREDIFMDIEDVSHGEDFAHTVEDKLWQCDVLLVLLGAHWLEIPEQRVAIHHALALNKLVVPVLLDGASIPDHLPDDIKGRLNRQLAFINYRTLDRDVQRIVERLRVSKLAVSHQSQQYAGRTPRTLDEHARNPTFYEYARRPANERLSIAVMTAAADHAYSHHPRNDIDPPLLSRRKLQERAREEAISQAAVDRRRREEAEQERARKEAQKTKTAGEPAAETTRENMVLSYGLLIFMGALLAGISLTDSGRSILDHVLSLFGLKLGAGLIPISVNRQPAEPNVDTVVCSVFGPPVAPPGEILIQVFLHMPSHAERAQFLATAMDSSATQKSTQFLETPIKRGAKVDISFSVSVLTVDEPVQSVIWQGEPTFAQFLVTIPHGSSGQSFFPVVRISVDGKLVGRIKFRIESKPTTTAQSEPLGDQARRYEHAFVSYATKDRKEVLKRVQMLPIMKTEFFQDILSLDPGDRWEKKLYENIDRSDLFLLFWSQAAKDSEWVIREAEYALKYQLQNPEAEPDIVPVILESNVAPPPSLAALHFNDRIQYLVSLMP
jgi:hypothetical protein